MKSGDAYDLLMLGHRMLAGRHHHQAVLLLEKAKDLEPHKGSIAEALGRALYNVGAIERAAEEFQTAVDLNPADDYAYFGLALCKARMGERGRAAGLLKIALAMRPNSKDYRRALDRLVF